MRHLILSIFLLCFSLASKAQVCNVNVSPVAIRITSDSTLTYSSISSFKSYVPCIGKDILLKGSGTTIDTFYLRAGNTLIIDSAMFLGGFNIYADSGSIVDCNFQQVQQLFYTPYTTLIDTISWGTATLCSDIVYNFSNMIQPYNCDPTNTSDVISPISEMFTTETEWRIILSNTNFYKMALYNLYGQKLAEEDIRNNTFNVDHSLLLKGIYFVSLEGEQSRYSLKVLKP